MYSHGTVRAREARRGERTRALLCAFARGNNGWEKLVISARDHDKEELSAAAGIKDTPAGRGSPQDRYVNHRYTRVLAFKSSAESLQLEGGTGEF